MRPIASGHSLPLSSGENPSGEPSPSPAGPSSASASFPLARAVAAAVAVSALAASLAGCMSVSDPEAPPTPCSGTWTEGCARY